MSKQKTAELIGYSAVKYFDLKQNRMTDYQFSFDRMLDPRGTTHQQSQDQRIDRSGEECEKAEMAQAIGGMEFYG